MADYTLNTLNKWIKKIQGDKVRTYDSIQEALVRLLLK